jgi:hypothetical protein
MKFNQIPSQSDKNKEDTDDDIIDNFDLIPIDENLENTNSKKENEDCDDDDNNNLEITIDQKLNDMK